MDASHKGSVFLVFQAVLYLLLIKALVVVLLGYRDYFPPDFASDFLRGRELDFGGVYRWAFYVHIVSGPSALLVGSLLVSQRLRTRYPRAHRILGRAQVVVVLLAVVPSGLWMSGYAESGIAAGLAFGSLAIAAGSCVAIGWRAAIQRRFSDHRRWMNRSFVLLCSAVVLRLIGGLGTVAGVESPWAYPLAAWTSWLVPLMGWELLRPRLVAMTPRAT